MVSTSKSPVNISIAGLCLFLSLSIVHAYQGDAAHEKALLKNAKAWAKEDKGINSRLQKLEKRFGKKPNIIYILGDDVGWGELGSYLGI